MRLLHHEVPPEPDRPDVVGAMRQASSEDQDRLLTRLFRKNHSN